MWRHYIYIHFRKSDGVPFYVGKGTSKSKSKNTYVRARAFHSANLHWKHTVEKHGLAINVIMSCLTDEEAQKQEKRIILEIGRNDLGLGTLVNMTDGGDGMCGRVVSDETKANLSIMFKGRPLSEDWRNAVKAARKNGGNGSVNGKLPDEWKRNIGLANSGSKNYNFGKTTKIARQVVCSTTGTIYPSVGKAAEDFNLNMKTLYNMLSGHRKNYTSLEFK